MKGEYLETLLRSPKTIFSTKDVALLWGEDDEKTITHRLYTYTQAGKLVRVRRGFYAKDNQYDRLELAGRMYTPAYISFETVLARTGVTFQHYDTIFVASYITRDITIGDQKISYVRMKDYVLSNTVGIEQIGTYSIASKERAILDRIYISKDYHFDNLGSVNWATIFELLPIYHNLTMEKTVKKYFTHYKTSNS